MKKNPYPYIAKADLFVQPSRVESFGLTIAEAMILGVPVLSTQTDGAKEIFEVKEAGLLCKISDEDIFEGIEKLKNDSPRYNDANLIFLEKNEHVIELLEELF